MKFSDVKNKIGKEKYVKFDLVRGPVVNNGGTPWYAKMKLGTPQQEFNFFLSTGTMHSYVTSNVCTTDACLAHNRFNKNNSVTYTQLTDPYNLKPISYGPVISMRVSLGNDFIEIPGESIREKIDIFMAHYYEGQQFKDAPCDGIFGIPSIKTAPGEQDKMQPTILLQMMVEKNIINIPAASFWTDYEKRTGECIFGGINPGKIQGKINWIPLTDAKHYPGYVKEYPFLWVINTQNIKVGDETIFDSVNFCLDTGSSVFKGDPKIINPLISEVTRRGRLDDTLEGPNPDFSEYPDLTIKINGIDYIIKPEKYFLQISQDTWVLAFNCVAGLKQLLLVGSVFLQEYYSIFLYINEKERYIGLADVKK